MKRRIFAFLLCLSLVLALAATGIPAHAETVNECDCGTTETNEAGELIHTAECAVNQPVEPAGPACEVEGCEGEGCTVDGCPCTAHHEAPVDPPVVTPACTDEKCTGEGCEVEGCTCALHHEASPEPPVDPPVVTPVCTDEKCTGEGCEVEDCTCTVHHEAPAEPPVETPDETPVCDVEGCKGEGCDVADCTCTNPAHHAPKCACDAQPDDFGTIIHKEGCPLYVKPGCNCGSTDDVHTADCPLYVAPSVQLCEHGADPSKCLVCSDSALYEALMNCPSIEEIDRIIESQTQERMNQFADSLTEEQLEELMTKIQEMSPPVEPPQTVPYTYAGPFLPPVQVTSGLRKLFRSFALNDDAEDGLVLSKKAVDNGDGTYTITLESYTTGRVSQSEKSVPVDVVLVLDQSGSMAFDFNGNKTNNNSSRRQYAMKQAVNGFIDSVAEKFSADADHRVSIVTFGSNASTLRDWTYVNQQGTTALHNSVNGLPSEPSGATNVAAGMQRAEGLMGNGYNYNGQNTSRQKVVIVFTDGIPTTSNTFSTTVATNAIKSSMSLKNGGATVYSIGIFTGANPNELYGSKWDYSSGTDIDCSGEPGSYWGGQGEIDVPAGNRFLNYLSTNSPDAVGIGITRGSYNPGNRWSGNSTGYRIDTNYTCTNTGHYLTAANADQLNNIFQTIADNISTPDIELGSETVIKDIISPYFTVPANTTDIKLYTEDYNGSQFDGVRDAATGVTASIAGDTISVTGFNYNANFITDVEHLDGGGFGKKLIIEFTVAPKSDFLGGNNVPTNGSESGVYLDGTVVENFEVPTVNVEVKTVTVVAEDKNVYLLSDLNMGQLLAGATVKVGDLGMDVIGTDTCWQDDFVTVTTTITDKDGNEVTDLTFQDLVADNSYQINVTATPKTNGQGAAGEPAGVQSGASGEKAINVFKPTLTFNDSEVYYGANAPEYKTTNWNSTITWKHQNADGTFTEDIHAYPAMIGSAPAANAFEITFTPDADRIVDGMIHTKADFYVNAEVKLFGTDIADYVNFEHAACSTEGCDFDNTKGEFMLHVETCSLTITKNGGTAGEPYVFDVYKDGKKYTEATVVGDGSVTIYELPVGDYSISEDMKWSWRFSAPTFTPNTKVLSAEAPNGEITCGNNFNVDQWLNGYSNVVTNKYTPNN